MNTYKAILAAALGLSVIGAAQAGNVYITGSTAMRGVVYNAMTNAGTVFKSEPAITAVAASGKESGATYMAFQGVLVGATGSGLTTVKCYWTGSEAGIADVAKVQTEGFLADSDVNTAAGTITDLSAFSTSPDSAVVNLCLADNAQTYSRTTTPVITGAKVGIVTFKWLRNPGVWTGANVTDQQIRAALGGACPIGLFTGANDDTSFVYVEGRDTSSGTRVNALGDSGYGIFSQVEQVYLSSGVMVDFDSNGTYETVSGFSSGGSLAGSLNASTVTATDKTSNGGTGFSVIAYLGYNDAKTALNGTPAAVELTYDGVPFSTANVENGTYNFWGNEYVYKASSVDAEAGLVYTDLTSISKGIDTIFDQLSAIPLDLMHASRPGPLGDPSHN
jgi:hypothetical protein